MDATNPAHVAANMVAARGRDAALERCDRYISGAIRSEESTEFWQSVRAEVLASDGAR